MLNNKILVAVDGSPVSLNALSYAKRIAEAYNLKMAIIYVIEEVPDIQDAAADSKYLNEPMKKIEAVVKDMGDRCVFVCKAGNPVDVIVEDSVEYGCDSIIIGDRGWNALTKAFLGSVSEGVLDKASVPVTIVRTHD